MAILGIISAGTKVQEFAGQPIMKVGGSNTLKLNRESLNLLGVDYGDFVFIAPDGEDANLYYIAGSKKATTEQGDRGSKLGVVGEKAKGTTNLPQLQFNHASLGTELFDKAAVFSINATTGEGEDAESTAFEFNGLTFYPMTILQTREEAVAEKDGKETAKQEEVNAAEDKAIAESTTGGRKGRGAASASAAVAE